MTEQRDATQILRDISVLYELSLSVGRSIELDENCDGFLRTLMARKSLDFASVWIHDHCAGSADEQAGEGLTQVYANPAFRSPLDKLAGAHPIAQRVAREPFFSVTHGEPGFEALVSEARIDRGTFAIYRLGDIGLLKLYSIARDQPFSHVELSKLRHVVEQFTVSLEGCLDHLRVRRAEQRRRELELQMLHAQKLESLGLLAGGVAHDFNNLLTAILGNAEFALQTADTHTREGLDNIVDASCRAAELCSQLLAYSGRGKFVIEPLALNDVAEEMLRLSTVTLSKKACMEVELDPQLPTTEGDATQIRQVIMNLLTNAAEAVGDASGQVRVTTGTLHVTAAQLADFQLGDQRKAGEYVYLEVADSGCGMAPETLQRIFDPFFTTKFTGRGLGLAAVLGIVRGHRGAIRVRSTPGQGTEVRVLFCPSRNAVIRSNPVDQAEGRWAAGTVLVVDDEDSVRRVLGRLLEGFGFEVLFASDGGEGLRVFEAERQRIGLVVLDLTMPVMSGGEVFQRLHTLDPEVRVVLTSGYSEAEACTRFKDVSPAAFLAKPFRAADVQRVVRSVLAGGARAQAAKPDPEPPGCGAESAARAGNG